MNTDFPIQRVVFTDGVFDMLHANHVSLLEEASSFGSRLVVGVVSDARTQEFKRLPVVDEQNRLHVVKALRCVDHAFIIHAPLTSETMEQIIREHAVDAVVYAGDNTPDFYLPAEQAGIMHRLPYRTGINTSRIIDQVVERFT
ncbi:MAG: adenylyltransferase/cytidyltransferase family protein [Hyphomicrobiales bacterium]|nr:adenylyltransferase/cytidyltransferase family protein [Hyphomicrobiales bacterium]MCP4998880.1 adenylyltransferase/cytidyltransferase family protein [Hyphomicrobiales bacterium]